MSDQEDPPPPYSDIDQHKEEPAGELDLPVLKVYKRRWYILGLFCLLACHQCVVWNTFGPIESSMQYAYHWSNSTAPMMANWGAIMFCAAVVPLSKLVEVSEEKDCFVFCAKCI